MGSELAFHPTQIVQNTEVGGVAVNIHVERASGFAVSPYFLTH